jgi:hypothetical protein
VGDAIPALRKAGVEIKSIVGDNQPVHVMDLIYWVPNSPFEISEIDGTENYFAPQ